MKKIILLTTLALVCMAVACVKNPPTPNCGQLPCPSAIGANVVSCYVNGVPYIAKGGKPDLTGIGGCKEGSYITSSALGGANTTLHFHFCDSGWPDRITLDITDTLKLGIYQLNGGVPARARLDGAGNFSGTTSATQLGSLEITSLSPKAVSGKFIFNVSNGNGINRITEGNFDLAR
jgi:hypothetical protein